MFRVKAWESSTVTYESGTRNIPACRHYVFSIGYYVPALGLKICCSHKASAKHKDQKFDSKTLPK